MFTVGLTVADIGLLDLLDDRERYRIGRCTGEADRGRMLLGAALLRAAAGALLGVSAGALAVDRTCVGCGDWHGRPTIRGTDLDVSVSHSGNIVTVATLRGGGRVGVDVERASDRPLTEVLAWTIAEARFKAGGGSGLTVHELPAPAPGHVLTVATDQPDATPEVSDGTALLSAWLHPA
ncbi:4'-phosphopantetheinyl transferase [Kribbella orskensis]|uniref:4'-phosphopantetheinyl transferase n=1 Tax=Kribbella orskensis TaxID=2512216 RepID=A0ABY2BN51_9ACTN|nr:4'-phosphopantetheinyl transferase [Kribbella sp. VKM Ac-2500]TCO25673.1 4'-phosphopantetheinyl transferase [Kribbella orskensis]